MGPNGLYRGKALLKMPSGSRSSEGSGCLMAVLLSVEIPIEIC